MLTQDWFLAIHCIDWRVYMVKIANRSFVNAGIEAMTAAGYAVTKEASAGRSVIYTMENGQTLRVRTCNDHVLLAIADSADPTSKMNIEGTDHLLIVMPVIERTLGEVMVFLVPTNVAAGAAREGYADWLSRNPNTRGNNKTRNLWFDDDTSRPGHGFQKHWEQYRLEVDVSVGETEADESRQSSEPSQYGKTQFQTEHDNGSPDIQPMRDKAAGVEKLGDVLARARSSIADAAGVEPSNVHISIDLD
jgi:hypothetical protein